MLYQKALALPWTKAENERLERPGVEFNPPVRFLQTKGHKEKLGVTYDTVNLKVVFADTEAEKKYQHLLRKLVVSSKGLGATSTWDDVFEDYEAEQGDTGATAATESGQPSSEADTSGGSPGSQASGPADGVSDAKPPKPKPGTLFAYPVSMNNALVAQLMKEAKELNCKRFPGAGTFLLRNVVEAVLKQIIDQQKANPASTTLDLEKSINLCMSNGVALPAEDKKVLKEFSKHHVSYLNLGAHGNVIPNPDRLFGARDCIDQFVKKHVGDDCFAAALSGR
jgi:hypothetical protein